MEHKIQQAIDLQRREKHQEAIGVYAHVLQQDPQNVSALVNAAIALREQKKYTSAHTYYARALKLRQDDASLWSNYGNLMCDMKRFDEAAQAFNKVLELKPEDPGHLYNAGVVPFNNNQPEKAIEFFNKALEIQPDHHGAKWNKALSQLQTGEYHAGFSGYEIRFSPNMTHRAFDRLPLWQGEDLSGKKILLCREQGLGDMIQFIRFAQVLKSRGAEVFVETNKPLKRFMFCVKGIDHVVDEGYHNPELDYFLPIMSLAHRLNLHIDELPETHDYVDVDKLIAPAELPGTSALKVGLVWASKPGHVANRSCDLELLLPLLEHDGVDFYSFQKVEGNNAITDLGVEGLIYDLDSHMPDFYDTAAYMKQMDLIISIDSSPLHCAAAIGVETWGLLLHAAEWRFMLNRDDSPWYPDLRLFRQYQHNDWREVLDTLFAQFESFIEAKTQG